MLKYLFAFIGFSCCFLTVNGQESFSYFNKTYYLEDTNTVISGTVENQFGTFAILKYINANSTYGAYLIHLDSRGEIIDSNLIYSYPTPVSGTQGQVFINSKDGNLLLVINKFEDRNAYPIGFEIFKLDVNGNIIWQLEVAHQNESREVIRSLIEVSTGGFIVYGFSQAQGQVARPYCAKISATGELEFEKYYTYQSRHIRPWHAIATSDGGFLFGGIIWKPNNTIGHQYIFKTNHLGELDWEKEWIADGVSGTPFLAETVDSNYLILNDTFNPDKYRYFLLSSHGEEIYTSTINSNYYYSTLVNRFYSGDTTTHIQFDYPTSDQKISDYYFVKSNNYVEPYYIKNITPPFDGIIQVNDFEKQSDGGYIVSGYPPNDTPQFAWIAKLDKDGNTCSIDTDSTVILTNSNNGQATIPEIKITAFPNPVIDQQLNIQITPPKTMAFYTIQLFGLNGKLYATNYYPGLETELPISTDDLMSGIYVLKIRDINGEWVYEEKLVVE